MKQDRKEKGNVPNLRFPQFRGEWEERIFDNICSITTGNKNTQDKEDDGLYPFYVRSQNIERINSYTFWGEAILTAGDGVGVGKIFHYVNGKVGVHQRVYILSGFKCSGKFAYYYFASQFHNRVQKMSAKNSVDSVRREMIAQMPISLPMTEEQQKIAKFLSLLDDRIQTQSKIIEKLKSLMKGLLCNLFCQEQHVPPLRFPEFEDKWKIYVISDLLEFFTTNSLSWEQLEYETKNIYNLHYGLIHNGLPTLIDMDKNKLPNIRQEHIPQVYTLCQDGDVVFADASEDTNDIAKAVEIFNCNGKEVVCGLHTIHGRDKLDITVKGFKGYAFSSNTFRHQIRRFAQGTKIYSISQKNFRESYIGIPSKKEQSKIAHLLQLIDFRISVESKLILNYQRQKEFLLKQMFI